MQTARREREVGRKFFVAGRGRCDGERAKNVPTAHVHGCRGVGACFWEAGIHVCCVSCGGDGYGGLEKIKAKGGGRMWNEKRCGCDLFRMLWSYLEDVLS